MKNHKRLIANLLEVIVGLILVLCSYLGLVDEYWSGMGTALIFVGIIMLLRLLRYRTNSEYKEKVDIEIKDERNSYLRVKAWASAGYLFAIIGAVASIAFKIMGYDAYSILSGGAVCLIMVLYWISYYVLKRKY